MFGLSLNPYALAAKAGALLAALVIGLWTGHHLTSQAWRAAEAKVLEQQAAQRVADEARLNDLSAQLETAKAKRDVVTKVITRTVNKIVERPVYVACQLDDDGLRWANASLRGAAPDPGGPDNKLPAPGPAGQPIDGVAPPKARGG